MITSGTSKARNGAVFLSGYLFNQYVLKLLSNDKCQATCISQSADITQARYFTSEIISVSVNLNKLSRYLIDARTEDLQR